MTRIPLRNLLFISLTPTPMPLGFLPYNLHFSQPRAVSMAVEEKNDVYSLSTHGRLMKVSPFAKKQVVLGYLEVGLAFDPIINEQVSPHHNES